MSSQNPKPTPIAGSKVPASALAKARPLGSAAAAGAVGDADAVAGSPVSTPARPVGAPVVLKGSASEAGRNLALGVLAVLVAVPMGGAAFWCAPRETFVAICSAALVSLCLFLAMQFRLLLQRNGVFLLLSCGLVLTLAVPICVRLMVAGSEWAQTLADFRRIQTAVPAGGANLQSNGSLAAGQTSAVSGTSPSISGTNAGSAVSGTAAVSTEASTGPTMQAAAKVEKEAQNARTPLSDATSEAEGPGNEDPVQKATRLARDEAVRRYPALQNPASAENAVYLEAYNELTRLRKFDFFKDPKWPLNLAEIVGLREGWKREDQKPKPFQPAPNAAPLPGSEIALDGPQVSARGSSEDAKTPQPQKPPADPEEQAVSQSTAEARRRYPAVGVEGSPENRAYLEAYQDLDGRRPDFFETPDWPVRLVELVAKREGWKRASPDSAPAGASGRPSAGTKELPLPR